MMIVLALAWPALARALCAYTGTTTVPAELGVTLAQAQSFVLPFLPETQPGAGRRRLAAGSFPYNVDWGDGSRLSGCDNASPCAHTYAAAGSYVVRLFGQEIVGWSLGGWLEQYGARNTTCTDRTLPSGALWKDTDDWKCSTYMGTPAACTWTNYRLSRNVYNGREACCVCGGGESGYRSVLTSIDAWGSIRLHTTSGRHLKYGRLARVAPLPASPGLLSLAHSFEDLVLLGNAGLDVSALDTSLVTDVRYAFNLQLGPGPVGLGAWNTSAVVHADWAFHACAGLAPDALPWDIRALANATRMFAYTPLFDADLAGWQLDGLQRTDMFLHASAFSGRGLVTTGADCYALFGQSPAVSLCARDGSEFVWDFIPLRPLDGSSLGLYTDKGGADNTFIEVDWDNGLAPVSCRMHDPNRICSPAQPLPVRETAYVVRVRGRVDGLYSTHNARYNINLLNVHAWGNVSLATNNGQALLVCSGCDGGYSLNKLRSLPHATSRVLGRITSCRNLFNQMFALTGNISGWALRCTGSLDSAFNSLAAFNQPLAAWDVSGVTSMVDTLYAAESFNQPLAGWNVSQVTDFTEMLAETYVFNQPLAAWDMRRATTLTYMFYNARAFNGDVSGWNVSAVVDMGWLFNRARSFNQPLAGWNVSQVTNMRNMFAYASKFNQPLAGWNVNGVPASQLGGMFTGACDFDQDLSSWSLAVTFSACNALASSSWLNYSQLPAGCRAWPSGDYAWNTATRESCRAAAAG